MEKVGAVLEFVGDVHPEAKGTIWSTSLSLPDGKKLEVKFTKNAEGKVTADVPFKVTFRDLAGKPVVFVENYAKDLLDAYGQSSKFKYLKFVKYIEKEEIEKPLLGEHEVNLEQEQKPEPEKKLGRPPKSKEPEKEGT